MKQHNSPIEGNWEQVLQHAAQFAGKRVRVTVLPDKRTPFSRKKTPAAIDKKTHRFLKEFAGTWMGDDLDACLQLVYSMRSETDR